MQLTTKKIVNCCKNAIKQFANVFKFRQDSDIISLLNESLYKTIEKCLKFPPIKRLSMNNLKVTKNNKFYIN